MKRSGFKPRKKPLTSSRGFVRKAEEEKAYAKVQGRAVKFKAKTPLKKRSRSRRREMDEYFKNAREFLKTNDRCMICVARGLTPNRATEVHHWAGRIGRLLNYLPFFIASCRPCREWPHDHRSEAEAAGVIAPPGEWNVFPA